MRHVLIDKPKTGENYRNSNFRSPQGRKRSSQGHIWIALSKAGFHATHCTLLQNILLVNEISTIILSPNEARENVKRILIILEVFLGE